MSNNTVDGKSPVRSMLLLIKVRAKFQSYIYALYTFTRKKSFARINGKYLVRYERDKRSFQSEFLFLHQTRIQPNPFSVHLTIPRQPIQQKSQILHTQLLSNSPKRPPQKFVEIWQFCAGHEIQRRISPFWTRFVCTE